MLISLHLIFFERGFTPMCKKNRHTFVNNYEVHYINQFLFRSLIFHIFFDILYSLAVLRYFKR